jgi:hypothetical protein
MRRHLLSLSLSPSLCFRFHSIGFVCEADASQRTPTKPKARQLRELAANAVASTPNLFTTAFLGMPNAAYQAQVLNPNSWGGFIELSIFSRHFGCQVRGQTRTRSQALLVSPLPPRQMGYRLPLAARNFLVITGVCARL